MKLHKRYQDDPLLAITLKESHMTTIKEMEWPVLTAEYDSQLSIYSPDG